MRFMLIMAVWAATSFAAPVETNRGGFILFLAGRHETPPAQAIPITEISIVNHYTLVILLTNVEPQKPLVAKITALDPQGKINVQHEKTWTPETTNTVVRCPIMSEPEDPIGLYSWKVEIDGFGTMEEKFTLLPEPPNDTPMHEQAAENAFLAFSKYWLGFNGDFFLILATENKILRKTITNYVNMHTGVKTRERPADFDPKRLPFTGPDKPFYDVQILEVQETYPSVQKLLQVKRLDYDFSKQWFLSPADKLNGITYRGEGHFSFELYRVYDTTEGWTDWFDVGLWKDWQPRPELGDLPLRFSLFQRDSNWVVTGSDGARFINGKLIQAGKASRYDTPSLEFVASSTFSVEWIGYGKFSGDEIEHCF